MAKERNSGKSVPIEWFVPDEVVTKYATNMVVQHSEHDFTLLFFEAQPPIIVGPTDQKQKALESVKSVTARCVARIVVAPARMKEFIRVLSENLTRYEERRKANKEK